MKPISLLILPILCLSCVNSQKSDIKNSTIVRIETTYGDIDIRLYDETPVHRDNFINLVTKGFYDDLLFHRVIDNFMIQGGDPGSKDAGEGTQLGSGGPGYTLPAEINDSLFHKKGALAAARLGDNVNPSKESSGSQFYIVQGAPLTETELDDIEARVNNEKKQNMYARVFKDIENEFLKENLEPDYEIITEKARETVIEHFNESNSFKYSPGQREIYTTIGGTPHLDGSYTVFGETIAGMDVLDKIAEVKTDRLSRPLSNVVMKIRLLDK